jgi:hypothetical protein
VFPVIKMQVDFWKYLLYDGKHSCVGSRNPIRPGLVGFRELLAENREFQNIWKKCRGGWNVKKRPGL